MNKILAALFLLLLCVVTSCKKSKSEDDTRNSRFAWYYDGTSYVAKHHKAVLLGMGAPFVSATLQDNPDLPADGPLIYLSSFEKGKYDFASNGKNYIYYTDKLGNVLLSLNGNAVITDRSEDHISGTFAATLSDNRLITGTFVKSSIYR